MRTWSTPLEKIRTGQWIIDDEEQVSNEDDSSLNGSSENYANVVVPSDSVSSDASKSVTTEVNYNSTSESTKNTPTEVQIDLSTFLIQRACEKPTIANYLFWFVLRSAPSLADS